MTRNTFEAKESYDQQALDFLEKTNTKFEVEYLGTYNRDDFGVRDNYKVTLTRGEREYSFIFSQSLVNSGKWHFIDDKSVANSYIAKTYAISHSDSKPSTMFGLINKLDKLFIVDNKIKVINGHENYYSLVNQIEIGKIKIIKNKNFRAPRPYDVLACLDKYEYQDFADFCSSLGYDEDSIKANKVYEAVKEEYLNLQKLFNDTELDELREIQ